MHETIRPSGHETLVIMKPPCHADGLHPGILSGLDVHGRISDDRAVLGTQSENVRNFKRSSRIRLVRNPSQLPQNHCEVDARKKLRYHRQGKWVWLVGQYREWVATGLQAF